MMLKRIYVLKVAGKSHCFGLTLGDIRRAISSSPDDDVDQITVERIFDVDSMAIPADVTFEVAKDWAGSCDFGDGIEPNEYLAPFPAFVRFHMADQLIAEYEKSMRAQAECSITVYIGKQKHSMSDSSKVGKEIRSVIDHHQWSGGGA